MPALKLQAATPRDASAIAALRNTGADHLTSQFGKGFWSGHVTEKGVLLDMRRGTVYVAKQNRKIVATLNLSTRKPWAIDKSYFHPSRQPLYLTNMAVAPEEQRKGVGRHCLDEARRIAKSWPADAIRLDAFDDPAGAGPFYAKCGMSEVGRATYRQAPLIYFELLL